MEPELSTPAGTSTALRRLPASAEVILGITRILAGILFACHGAQIVLGVFGGIPSGVPFAVHWIAGPIELLGGALIAIGLFARSAAFLCSGMMAVAYFMAHAPGGLWPILNGGELSILYCWFFLYIAAHGPGGLAVAAVGKGQR